MATVTVYHPGIAGLAHIPGDEWNRAHYAERGWLPVPGTVNLADPEAVDELLHGPTVIERPASSAKKDDWLVYVRTLVTEDEIGVVDAMTKEQLIAEADKRPQPTTTEDETAATADGSASSEEE